MRVMLDTNVLVSAAILGSPSMSGIVDDVVLHHELLLGSYALDELRDVVRRKFPGKSEDIERLLSDAEYELVETPSATDAFRVAMRDPKDVPVLAEAIAGRADILVTGDKDFEDITLETPEVITPGQYRERFIESLCGPQR